MPTSRQVLKYLLRCHYLCCIEKRINQYNMCLTASNKEDEHGNHGLVNPPTATFSDPITPHLFAKPDCLSTESYSLLILIFSAMFYSIMAAYIQLAAATGLSSTELVFLRAIFQGTLVVLAMFWYRDVDTHDGKYRQGRRLIWLPFGAPHVRNVVVARGIVGGCGFLLYYYTISVLPLGDATTLLSLNPIVTVFAASIFLNEPLVITHIMAALVSLIGCVLIAKPSFLFNRGDAAVFDEEQHSSTGYITALMGACCGATVYILIRRAGKGGVHTLQLLFSWVTFGTFFSLVVGVIVPFGFGQGLLFVWPSSTQAWVYVWGVCIFGSLGHLLMNYAARHAPAGLASIMRSSGIMWSYGLEVFIFDQVPRPLTVGGALLIVFSLATIAIEKQRESMQQKEISQQTKESLSLIEEHRSNHNKNSPVKTDAGTDASTYGSVNDF